MSQEIDPTCPQGYIFDKATCQCVLDTKPDEVDPHCPPGYFFNTALCQCEQALPPPPTGGFKFNLGGDFRAGQDAKATAVNLVSDTPDILFFLGDYAVGDASASDWCNNIMAPVKNSGIPVWGILGNHDSGGSAYLATGFFKNTGWVWSVKKGKVAFISCNTIAESVNETQPLIAEAQNDPAISNIVILMHESVFKGEGGDTSGSDTTIAYHNMFKQHSKIKLVIAGHSHNYRRFSPYEGITYVIIEDGGQQPDANTGCMHCSSDNMGNLTCKMVSNGGVTNDTFTILVSV